LNKKYLPPNPDIDGWMAMEALQWLFETASTMENVVEIGCWLGRSTHALLTGCKGTVYAIDHFKGSPSERDAAHAPAKTRDIGSDFLRNVGHFPNLKLLKMDSVEAVKQFEPKSVDMVFIDGSHDYRDFNADFTGWLPVCRKIICGHDASYGGVKKVLKESGLQFTIEVGELWSIVL
jgi:predicted O-methyltransferase YrrM